ncbi:hypothetical protein RHECIAT_CH0002452 [Rhizobium etli CIAT 652]|uniref:Uncharacterized protein n=1 Tax=Rhizobium etli (strain CIAT 652) TaxID=491916 RepID=B3PPX6_RHIE6|nr:hypothetical protein RHECIAT_CH0002452 [Rhizobium etli CIAT 652]KKZ85634.1 hypothetical protein RPHASCH2410_CH20930 [Rhizobium phaseoli Ch24-10]
MQRRQVQIVHDFLPATGAPHRRGRHFALAAVARQVSPKGLAGRSGRDVGHDREIGRMAAGLIAGQKLGPDRSLHFQRSPGRSSGPSRKLRLSPISILSPVSD